MIDHESRRGSGNNVEAGQWRTVLGPLRTGVAALEQLNGLALPAGLLGGGLKSAELRLGVLEPDPAATLVALLEGSAPSLAELNLGCDARAQPCGSGV